MVAKIAARVIVLNLTSKILFRYKNHNNTYVTHVVIGRSNATRKKSILRPHELELSFLKRLFMCVGEKQCCTEDSNLGTYFFK